MPFMKKKVKVENVVCNTFIFRWAPPTRAAGEKEEISRGRRTEPLAFRLTRWEKLKLSFDSKVKQDVLR